MTPQTDSNAGGSADRRAGPAVVYFAKEPTPGAVKTRLVPPLTAAEAAGLYGAFLRDVLVPVPGARTLVYGWSEGGLDTLSTLVPARIELRPQRGADLFERMTRCMQELFDEGHAPVLIRNTDSPDLPAERVDEALRSCGAGTVVLGPDDGGGYYLVALAAPCTELFAGLAQRRAAQVYDATAQRAAELGLRVVALPRERDVDTFDDLVAMWRDRQRG